jgi:hypothetical protein
MQHVLLIHANVEGYAGLGPEEFDKMYAEHEAFQTALAEAGVTRPYSVELQPSPSAKIVRPAGDDWLLTDGPFTETKEQLGGFYVIDVPDLDTAVSWAKRIPVIPGDAVEVRPAKTSGE